MPPDQELQQEPLQTTPETPAVETPETPAAPAAEAPQYTELELEAMKQGWKPLDQWEGEPEKHRSAREFLDRGELLGVQKQMRDELRELRNQIRFMSEHQRKVQSAAYEQALKDLRAQKAEAIERGDGQAAVILDEQIDMQRQALNAVKQAPPQQEPGTDSAIFQDWLTKNQWYKTDMGKKVWADNLAVEYAKAAQRSGRVFTERELYEFLHEEARKTFRMEDNRAAPGARPPSPDGSGRQSGNAARANHGAAKSPEAQFKSLVSGFSDADRRAAENWIKQGLMTHEQFVKDFELVNRGR